jgi:hypothetical protein
LVIQVILAKVFLGLAKTWLTKNEIFTMMGLGCYLMVISNREWSQNAFFARK